MENQRAFIVVTVVFILIVVGMFGYSYLKRSELSTQPAGEVTEQPSETKDALPRINAKHFYRNGMHTLAGEILMPTPCDLLETNAMIVTPEEGVPGPSEERAVIYFNVINTAETCVQVVTPQRFKVSFVGGEDIQMEAFLRGKPAELNLIRAGENEDPDDFELFIKG